MNCPLMDCATWVTMKLQCFQSSVIIVSLASLLLRDEDYGQLAEGYYTVKALVELSERYQVELPISKAVYGILYEHADPRMTLHQLFTRSLKNEF